MERGEPIENWYDPNVRDLAADDEKLKEPDEGLLLAGDITTFRPCVYLETWVEPVEAATAHTLTGAVDDNPQPSPEDVRWLMEGATEGDWMETLVPTEVEKLKVYFVDNKLPPK